MKRKRLIRAAAAPAAALMFATGLAAAPAMASSHREAPATSQDPTADNTDFYMFRDATDATKVNVIANFIGLEDPQGGPNFQKFGDDVLYQVHLDSNGDVADDITYNFRFRSTISNPDTFLYNTGQLTTPTDTDLNVKQTYSVERVDSSGTETLATDVPTPPINVGTRSTPNYEANLAAPTVTNLAGGGGKVFAGVRQDPFFVDTGSAFDLLGLRPFNNAHAITPPSNSAGVNGLAGKNVHTIALQLPITEVSKNGDVPTTVDSKDSILGGYASTSRQRVRVLALDGAAPRNSGRWVQTSRLGVPLVNEVLIPLSQKDAFNARAPKDDGSFLGPILDPEPAKLIEALYPGVSTPDGGLNPDGTPKRADIVAVLTGQGAGLSAANALPPADLLRVNLAVAPDNGTADSRLGILGGDAQGFPNGRRLADDVVDIELRLLAGGTPFNPDPATNGSGNGGNDPQDELSDGVNSDDATLLGTFPYVATPYDGYRQNVAGQTAP